MKEHLRCSSCVVGLRVNQACGLLRPEASAVTSYKPTPGTNPAATPHMDQIGPMS
jgi:hypothetical protein